MEPGSRWASPESLALALALAITAFVPLAAEIFCHLSNAPVAGDQAIYEIETINATRGIQLLGPYSRLHFHHPGPLFFYLAAPLYKLLSAPALPLTAWFVNLLSALAVIRGSQRMGGWRLACWSTILLSVWLRALPDATVVSGWPPKAVLIPMLAFMVYCNEIALGEIRVLPYAAFFASYVAQTHVASVPLAAGIGAVAATFFLIRRRQAKLSWKLFVPTVLVCVICWSLPVYQQLTAPDGNITSITRALVLEPASPGQGLAAAWRATLDGCAAVPSVVANMAGRAPSPESLRWLTYVLLIGQLLLTFVKRPHKRLALCGTALLWAGIFVGIFAVRSIDSQAPRYLLLWTNGLGFLLYFLLGASAFESQLSKLWTVRWTLPIVAAVLGFLFIQNRAEVALYWSLPYERLGRVEQVGPLGIDRFVDAIRKCHGRPVFSIPGHDAWPRAAGVIAYLYRTGMEFSVSPEWVSMFGDQFAPNGPERNRLAFTLDESLDQKKPGYQFLAEQEGLFLYQWSLVTASSLRPLGPGAVMRTHWAEGDADRLINGDLPPEHTPWQDTPCVVFREPGAYVELRLPPHTETKLFLCADTQHTYTILGSREQAAFRKIGKMSGEGGSGLRYALVCSSQLPECNYIRIVAESGDGRFSLAQVALLP